MKEVLSGPNLNKLPGYRLKALRVDFKKNYILPANVIATLSRLGQIGFFSYGKLMGYLYMPMTSCN